MPLHPQAQAIVDGDPIRGIDLAATPVYALRALMDERQKRLAGPPPPVGRIEDRAIAGPATMLHVRIYWPENAGAERLPVYLYLHSGGYVVYSVEVADVPCRHICSLARCIVVSLDYRLAPDAPFPAAIEDSAAALDWLVANAVTLGGDPRRLAVGGDSCGATMASVLAILARDRGGPAIRQVVMQGPLCEIRPPDPAPDGRAGLAAWMRTKYVRSPAEAKDPRASPLLTPDLSRLPPHLVLIGEMDGLKPQATAYAERLRQAGVAVELKEFPGMIHNFTGMSAALDGARVGLEAAAAALRTAFRA
jgi:acetyl esterase